MIPSFDLVGQDTKDKWIDNPLHHMLLITYILAAFIIECLLITRIVKLQKNESTLETVTVGSKVVSSKPAVAV